MRSNQFLLQSCVFVTLIFCICQVLSVVVTCPQLSAPENGRIFVSDLTEDSFASYTCNHGYTRTGSNFQQCQASGNWSLEAPTCVITDCNNASTPNNGGTNQTHTTYGSKVDYYCDVGYNLIGSNNATCESSGSWSNSAPNCTIVDCNNPTAKTNGQVNFTVTTFGSQVDYYCDVGYTLDGPNNATCLSSGSWSNSAPNCTIVDCNNASTPKNGGKNETSTTYGSQVDYYCDIGYNLIGSNNTTCESSGSWSNSVPTCTIVVCGNASTPTNGGVNQTSVTYRSQVDYYCNEGYTLNGPNNATCEASGSWSNNEPNCTIVDCNTVEAPENGFVDITQTVFGSSVSYTCETGYEVTDGSNVRFCGADGNWTGSEPQCSIVDCDNASIPTNGGTNQTNTTYGSRVDYYCDEGYTLDGANDTTCLSSSSWSNSVPNCTIVDCNNASTPKNGGKNETSTTYTSQVDYYCDVGYNLIGSNNTTCESSGSWSNSVPTCTIVDCGNASTPNNGGKRQNSTTYISQVDYYCDVGYTLDGPNNTRCLDTGSWSNSAPNCTIVDCSNASTPKNGGKNETSTTYTSQVDYYCDVGYNLIGSNNTTCESSGSWSNSVPTCTIVDCSNASTPKNGGTNQTSTTYGSQVDYYCDEGYNLIGSSNATCELSGSWSNSVPTCTIVDCGNASTPNNGGKRQNSTTYISQVDYYCDVGYTLDGPNNTRCLDTGSWSDSAPNCTIVDCSNASTPKNGGKNETSTTYTSQVDYYCNIGYNLIGSNNTTCESSGSWSNSVPTCTIVDCSNASTPKNGGTNQTSTTYTSQVDYYCDIGYNLIGSNNATCESSGSWSNSVPTCTIVDCSNASTPNNGGKRQNSTTYLSQVDYYCDVGYTLDGPNNTACLSSGSWSDSAPNCTIVDCSNASTPKNGGKNETSTTYTSQVDYYCDIGYNLIGSSNATCESSGSWSNSVPTCTIVVCSNASTPTNGGVNQTSVTYRSQVDYFCNEGYTLNGPNNATCEASGSWSNSAPNCTIVECSTIEAPDNGFVDITQTVFGSSVSYTCETGYEVTGGSNVRFCGADGNWTGSEPQCSIVDCSNASIPTNGGTNQTNTTYGSQVDYYCDVGYTLDGASNTTCLDTGSWSNSAPNCTIVDCNNASTPKNGGKNETSTTYTSQVDYYCDIGYNLIGSNNTTCESSGSWSNSVPTCTIVDCDNASTPNNGGKRQNSTTYLSQVDYYCDVGYTLDGPNNTRCLDSGSWSNRAPNCTIVDCSNASTPKNGGKNETSTTYTSQVDYYCDVGYNLIGSNNTTCESSGSWSNNVPTCTIAVCGNTSTPTNGGVNQTSVTYSSQVDYYCNDGYTLNGPNNATCEASGFWSNNGPNCTIVDCNTVEAPENGFVDVNQTVFGSSVSYTCETGYEVTGGSNVRFCGADGNWTGSEPQCSIVDCGNLTIPANGMIVYSDNSTTYGTVANYTCDTGFALINGSAIRTCQDSKVWSGNESSCEIYTCPPLSNLTDGYMNGSGNVFGSVITYHCNIGYELSISNNTIVCGEGSWTPSPPTCSIKDCGKISTSIGNGTVNQTGTEYGDTSFYQCNNLTMIENGITSRLLNCTAEGDWDGVAPTACIPTDCGDLSRPQDGQVNTQPGTGYNKIAAYTCDDGYILQGTNTRLCKADGLWDGAEPTCLIVDCRNLTSPKNGSVDLSQGTTYLKTAFYTCNTGYENINGSLSQTCQPNATWDGSPPVCVRKVCGSLSNISNASLNQTGIVYEDVAVYTCEVGYFITPGVTSLLLYCNETGTWNNTVPACLPVDCGDLPEPDGGQIHYHNTSYKTIASYTCNTGYNSTGINYRECGEDGIWTNSPLTCIIKNCGPLKNPTNGNVTVNMTTYGEYAYYQCVTGYHITSGSSAVFCDADERWNDTVPVCELWDCGGLNASSNGMVNTSQGTTYLQVGNYSCVVGYELRGQNSSQCQADGTWSERTPSCHIYDCGSLPSNISFSTLTISNTTYNETAVYTCDTGYRIAGTNNTNVSLSCLDGGRWSDVPSRCLPVDCGRLNNPENGMVNASQGTTYLQVANYSCMVGYELRGHNSSQCQANGTWSKAPPSCHIYNCGSPPNVTSSTLNISGITYNESAVYTCNKGYVINGTNDTVITLTCLIGGRWSNPPPLCTIVDCGSLDAPVNGNVTMSQGTTYLQRANFTCITGYQLVGSSMRQCQVDGSWSNDQPSCIIYDCGDIDTVNNSKVTFNVTTYSATATYTCHTGYYISSGDITRTCVHGGTWNGSTPTCTIYDCGKLEDLKNGTILGNGTLYTDEVTYLCDEGYVIQGTELFEMKSICQLGGNWSVELPVCEFVDCGQLDHPVNGRVLTVNGTGLGAIATYECYPWFKLIDDVPRRCNASFQWSNEKPFCMSVRPVRAITCGYSHEDLVLGLGISRTLSNVEFEIAKDCVKYTTRRSDITSDDMRVGMFMFTDTIYHEIALNEYNSTDVYHSAVDAVPYIENPGPPLLSTGLISLLSLFDSHDGNRPNIPDYAYIVLDAFTLENDTMVLAEMVAAKGIHLTFIAVGLSAIQYDVLDKLPKADMFYLSSFSELFMMSQTALSQPDWCDCGIPVAPDHGHVSVTGTYYLDTASFSCDEGFKLIGLPQMTCLYGGIWSNGSHACIPEDVIDIPVQQPCGMVNLDLVMAIGISRMTEWSDFDVYKKVVETFIKRSAVDQHLVNFGFFIFDTSVWENMIDLSDHNHQEDLLPHVDYTMYKPSSNSSNLVIALTEILKMANNRPAYVRHEKMEAYIIIDDDVSLTGSADVAKQLGDIGVIVNIVAVGFTETGGLTELVVSEDKVLPVESTQELSIILLFLFQDQECDCGGPEWMEDTGYYFLNSTQFRCWDDDEEMVGASIIQCQLGGYWSHPPPICINDSERNIDCGFRKVDVIIALGVSSAINESDYHVMQLSASKLINHSAVDEGLTRIGFFVFDNAVHRSSIVDVNSVTNRQDLLMALNKTSYTSTSGESVLHVAQKQIIEMHLASRGILHPVPLVAVFFLDNHVSLVEANIFATVLEEMHVRVIINAVGYNASNETDFEFNEFTRVNAWSSYKDMESNAMFDEEKCGCGILMAPGNGSVDWTGTLYLDVATFTCDPGYGLIGSQELICLYNGTWSGSRPYCNMLDVPLSIYNTCGFRNLDIVIALSVSNTTDEIEFEEMKNVVKHVIGVTDVESESTQMAFIVFDTAVAYSSRLNDTKTRSDLHLMVDRFQYQPSPIRSSLSLGLSNVLSIFSEPENNPAAADVVYLIIDEQIDLTSSELYATMAKKQGIHVDYIAVGFEDSEELHHLGHAIDFTSFHELEMKASTWYKDPLCHCDDNINIDNGTISMASGYYLDTANFACNQGFKLNGSSELQCLFTGQWSGPPPICSVKAANESVDMVLNLNMSSSPDLNVNDTYNAYMEAVKKALELHYGSLKNNSFINIAINNLSPGSLIVSFTATIPNEVKSAELFAEATTELAKGAVVEVLNESLSANQMFFQGSQVDLVTVSESVASCITFIQVIGPCEAGYICQLVNVSTPHCLPDPSTDCGFPGVHMFGSIDITSGTLYGNTIVYTCSKGFSLVGTNTRQCFPDAVWHPEPPVCNVTNCGNLTSPEHGSIDLPGGTTFGQTAVYACDTGYIPVGPSTLTCTETGFWNSNPPFCQASVDYCGILPYPENGFINFSNNSQLDSVATYSCIKGYKRVGPSTRICSATTIWEHQQSTICELHDCGNLDSPENGFINLTGTTYGQTATFSCQPGYYPIGETLLSCTSNGTWSSDPPTCRLLSHFCGGLFDPQNGRLTISMVSSSELNATFVCNTGYKLSGPKSRTCSMNGTWLPEEMTRCTLHNCGVLLNPDNGNVDQSSGTTYGQVVHYTCSAGYDLFGEDQAVCNADGYWSNEPPTCQITNCDGLSKPFHGTVSAEQTTFGQVASYSCDSGYKISGTSKRVCQTDGTWSGQVPSCLPKDCGTLFAPINGFVDLSEGTLFGNTVTFSCRNGFSLNGADKTLCSETGVWNPARAPTCEPIDCLQPPAVEHGMIELTQGTRFGSVATYMCDTGYQIDSSNTRQCTADGGWFPLTQISCEIIDCGKLPDVKHGEVLYMTNKTDYGSIARFSCNLGYKLSVNELFSTTCLESGDWDSSTLPQCELLDCGRPPSVDNGNMAYSSTTYRSVVVYSCDPGYVFSATEDVMCMATGAWVDVPTCEKLACGNIAAPQYGSISLSDGTFYNSIATITCNNGYKLIGPNSKVCLPSKVWQPVQTTTCTLHDCGVIPHPDNGLVDLSSGTTFGRIANFSCNVGYARFGAEQVACTEDGIWSAPPPVCQITDCGGLQNPVHGSVTADRTTVSQTAMYSCNPGYTLQGTSSRICQLDGSWSGNAATCEAKDCGPLNDPEHGHVVYSAGTLYGNSVRYVCETGYQLNGDTGRTCLDSGLWSNSAPTCVILDCEQWPDIENGHIDEALSTTYGSIVTYECDNGYIMSGNPSIDCLATGQWSSKPQCALNECSNLGNPDNGEVTVFGTGFGNSALYQCNVGYKITGMSARLCQEDGTWSGDEPTCMIADCGSLSPPDNGFVGFSSGTQYKNFIVFECDPMHEKAGPPAVVCRADGTWSSQVPTCTLQDGYLTQKIEIQLNMTVQQGLSFEDYVEEVAGEMSEYYTSQMNNVNVGVIIERLELGNLLVVLYTVVLPDDMVAKQQFSMASQQLAQVSTIMVFNEPLSVTWMTIGDNPGNIVSLPSGELACMFYEQVAGPCAQGFVCQVVNGLPGCGADPSTDCGVPPRPFNGKIDYERGTTLGDVVIYSCNLGYTLVGDNTRICQAGGAWAPALPFCIITNCGGLDKPLDGSIQILDTSYGSTASFTCNPGYSLIGLPSLICEADGEWSSIPPECKLTGCGGLTTPDNGQVVVTNNGQTAVYSCNNGYILSTSGIRTCLSSNVWSGLPPFCQLVACGVLTNPLNGRVEYTDTSFGSSATYTCTTDGYLLNGLQSRLCGGDGLWTGNPPTCDLVDCGQLLPVTNGNLQLTGTTFGWTGTFSCNTDYILQGTRVLTCLVSGWNDTPPTCIPTGNCGLLDNPANGYVTLSAGSLLGSVATYACYTGYRLTGTNTRTCLANNDWSGSPLSCILIDCGQLTIPTGGRIDYVFGTTYSKTANYTCYIGYNLIGPAYTVCQGDGTWSDTPTCRIKDCGDLVNPTNGRVDILAGTTFGSTASYICNTGYYIQGASNRQCLENGIWDNAAPMCIIKDCGSLTNPLNGIVSLSSGTTYGQTATYACNAGFSLSGSPTVQCREDGVWAGTQPICVPVVCGLLANPGNGRVILSNGRGVGSVATYRCDVSYAVTPSNLNKTCLEDGTWSNSVMPSCTYVDCGDLTAPLFGDVAIDISGHVASYTCNLGYMMSGTQTRRCENNQWVGSAPICVVTDCGALTNPDHGKVSKPANSRYGTKAIYECDAGYSLNGYYKRTCQSNGTWSGEVVTCKSSDDYALAIGLGVGISGFIILIIIIVLIIFVLHRRQNYIPHKRKPSRPEVLVTRSNWIPTFPRTTKTRSTIYLPHYSNGAFQDNHSEVTEQYPTWKSRKADYDNNPLFYTMNMPRDEQYALYPR